MPFVSILAAVAPHVAGRPVLAHAATMPAKAAGPGLAGAFFALLLVLGLIVAIAWLVRRMPGVGLRAAPGLSVVASVAVGAKERLVVVAVGDQQLLIGIGAGGLRTLHVLAEPLPVAAAPKPLDFPQMLARYRASKDA